MAYMAKLYSTWQDEQVVSLTQAIEANFASIAGPENFSVTLLSNRPQAIDDYWATLVHLENSNGIMEFSSHFQDTQLTDLAVSAFKKVNAIELNHILDMMKEFCNLNGGAFKNILNGGRESFLMSVPLACRSKNLPILLRPHGKDTMEYWWEITAGNYKIYCQFESVLTEGHEQ
jgi:hypothetical protein